MSPIRSRSYFIPILHRGRRRQREREGTCPRSDRKPVVEPGYEHRFPEPPFAALTTKLFLPPLFGRNDKVSLTWEVPCRDSASRFLISCGKDALDKRHPCSEEHPAKYLCVCTRGKQSPMQVPSPFSLAQGFIGAERHWSTRNVEFGYHGHFYENHRHGRCFVPLLPHVDICTVELSWKPDGQFRAGP